MKKSKSSKRTIFIILIAILTYFGGGDKYINQALAFVGNALIAEEGSVSKSEDKKSHIEGTIVHVSDGDTATLIDQDGAKHKIRLNGIDAPEIGQDYAEQSKSFVEKLALNKKVSVEIIGKDQYNRILGVLYVGKTNVNEELLANGLAWQYRFNKNPDYEQLALNAKTAHLNIWSDANALDPYIWRKQNRK